MRRTNKNSQLINQSNSDDIYRFRCMEYLNFVLDQIVNSENKFKIYNSHIQNLLRINLSNITIQDIQKIKRMLEQGQKIKSQTQQTGQFINYELTNRQKYLNRSTYQYLQQDPQQALIQLSGLNEYSLNKVQLQKNFIKRQKLQQYNYKTLDSMFKVFDDQKEYIHQFQEKGKNVVQGEYELQNAQFNVQKPKLDSNVPNNNNIVDQNIKQVKKQTNQTENIDKLFQEHKIPLLDKQFTIQVEQKLKQKQIRTQKQYKREKNKQKSKSNQKQQHKIGPILSKNKQNDEKLNQSVDLNLSFVQIQKKRKQKRKIIKPTQTTNNINNINIQNSQLNPANNNKLNTQNISQNDKVENYQQQIHNDHQNANEIQINQQQQKKQSTPYKEQDQKSEYKLGQKTEKRKYIRKKPLQPKKPKKVTNQAIQNVEASQLHLVNSEHSNRIENKQSKNEQLNPQILKKPANNNQAPINVLQGIILQTNQQKQQQQKIIKKTKPIKKQKKVELNKKHSKQFIEIVRQNSEQKQKQYSRENNIKLNFDHQQKHQDSFKHHEDTLKNQDYFIRTQNDQLFKPYKNSDKKQTNDKDNDNDKKIQQKKIKPKQSIKITNSVQIKLPHQIKPQEVNQIEKTVLQLNQMYKNSQRQIDQQEQFELNARQNIDLERQKIVLMKKEQRQSSSNPLNISKTNSYIFNQTSALSNQNKPFLDKQLANQQLALLEQFNSSRNQSQNWSKQKKKHELKQKVITKPDLLALREDQIIQNNVDEIKQNQEEIKSSYKQSSIDQLQKSEKGNQQIAQKKQRKKLKQLKYNQTKKELKKSSSQQYQPAQDQLSGSQQQENNQYQVQQGSKVTIQKPKRSYKKRISKKEKMEKLFMNKSAENVSNMNELNLNSQLYRSAQNNVNSDTIKNDQNMISKQQIKISQSLQNDINQHKQKRRRFTQEQRDKMKQQKQRAKQARLKQRQQKKKLKQMEKSQKQSKRGKKPQKIQIKPLKSQIIQIIQQEQQINNETKREVNNQVESIQKNKLHQQLQRRKENDQQQLLIAIQKTQNQKEQDKQLKQQQEKQDVISQQQIINQPQKLAQNLKIAQSQSIFKDQIATPQKNGNQLIRKDNGNQCSNIQHNNQQKKNKSNPNNNDVNISLNSTKQDISINQASYDIIKQEPQNFQKEKGQIFSTYMRENKQPIIASNLNKIVDRNQISNSPSKNIKSQYFQSINRNQRLVELQQMDLGPRKKVKITRQQSHIYQLPEYLISNNQQPKRQFQQNNFDKQLKLQIKISQLSEKESSEGNQFQ